ncbi:MAG: hypothetical protein RBT71_03645, partial [Flavobacteriales bacterium]|nr:hypothetical protein [Flavobacteriales bacterium]
MKPALQPTLALLLSLALPLTTTAQVAGPEDIPGDILLMLAPDGRAGQVAHDLRTVDGVPTGMRVDHEVSAPMRIWLLKFTPGTVSQ